MIATLDLYRQKRHRALPHSETLLTLADQHCATEARLSKPPPLTPFRISATVQMLASVLCGNGYTAFFWLVFQMPQCFADQLTSMFDMGVCNVEIKHRWYSIGSGRQHVNSQAVRLLDKLPGGNASQPEANNVRLNCCGIDVDFGVRSDPASKVRSARMDFSESAAMMFQRIKGSGRNDSSLPEATAKLLFESSSPGDETFSGQRGRSRRARREPSRSTR
jgi:hypothetical protein